MQLRAPARHNEKLQRLLDTANADPELEQLFRSCNVNAVDRSGMSDHGQVHIQIVTNAALRLLRLLADAGVEPNVVSNYELASEDAEVVVALAAILHDLGIAIHRHDHENHSLVFAYPKARQLLEGIYQEPELTIIVSDVLHAISAHRSDASCLTLEAGVVKVADALDMTQGRSRIPFEAGRVNIHSVSAMAIESVDILRGEERPIHIVVTLSDSAGIFQVDELLSAKLATSTLVSHVKVTAMLSGKAEPIKVYE